MRKLPYPKLKEDLYTCTLENGLQVYYMEKKGFEKSFAMLSTNFGSIDSVFSVDGALTTLPDGVAHFLEHKVFEQKEGNALQMFAKTGASPNAFTSHNMTAYYFGCTSGFEENLNILLTFVYHPYFTDENVEKEQGIIAQEIAMIHDNPNWQAYTRLFAAMYETHNIKNSIAGTKESIGKIDKALLYHCHKTFYDPKNMVLCIAGDVDIKNALDMAKKLTPKSQKSAPVLENKESLSCVKARETTMEMEVSMPLFLLGLKDNESRYDAGYNTLAGLAVTYLLGSSSPLYASLYKDGLINASFESEYSLFTGGGAVICGGESRDPKAVRAAVLEEIRSLVKTGMDEALFQRVKKASYGASVRLLDSPEELCVVQTMAHFYGNNYYDFAEIYNGIQSQDIQSFWSRFLEDNTAALSIITPKQKTKG